MLYSVFITRTKLIYEKLRGKHKLIKLLLLNYDEPRHYLCKILKKPIIVEE
jgi:hypothetical protein